MIITHLESLRTLLLTHLRDSQSELLLGKRERIHLSHILADDAFLIRFLAKNNDIQQTCTLILSHLDWRLDANITSRCVSSLKEGALKYYESGLFYYAGFDNQGGPLAVLDIGLYNRNDNVNDLRIFLVFFLEVSRKYISSLHLKNNTITTFSVILDLKSLGMSNLSYELFPTFYDLLHSQYPKIIGTVYVLNYSWVYSGIFSIVRTLLPKSATDKIKFLESAKVEEYLNVDLLPVGIFILIKNTVERN